MIACAPSLAAFLPDPLFHSVEFRRHALPRQIEQGIRSLTAGHDGGIRGEYGKREKTDFFLFIDKLQERR